MTRKRKTPADEPKTEWDAADTEWKAEHAKGTEPESLPLPFDDSEEVTRENAAFRFEDAQRAEVETKVLASEKAALERFGALDTSLPVEIEAVSSRDAEVAIVVGLSVLEQTLALIDEYVARCTSGQSVDLAELRELRKRVSEL